MSEMAHSPIGASSMHRWENCPGSVRLCKTVPNRSSAYSEEGTLAHTVASEILEGKAYAEILPEGMLDAVWVYVHFVNGIREKHPDSVVLIEHRFALDKIHPGLFGTADCVIYVREEKLLYVIDYKHGAGVPVEVRENEQLMYYGLGALLSTGYPCRHVELVIVQPRCPHSDGPIRSWKFEALELLNFADRLALSAARTTNEQAPLVPGEHCRFCSASGICPKIHEKALEIARTEFSPSLSYDPATLAQALSWAPVLEGWAKNLREFAYAEAQHGRCPPGWKLVAKRATRRWRTEDGLADGLALRTGLGREEFFERRIKSPAQVEKLVKKVNLTELTVAESSGLALVPAEDKRPAAKPDALAEFEVIATETTEGNE